MSKKNKSVREMLEKIYGKKCMVHQGIRKIKPPTPKKGRYKGKSIAYQLTLHHLKPLRRNGPTTIENGAVVCRTCHDWIEQLSEAEREKVNNELRAYKNGFDINIAELTTAGIIQAKKFEFDMSDCITIPLEKTLERNRETTKQRRAREKRELRQEMEELEYER